MDIKEIIKWTLKHWWWFVISVGVCVGIGAAYFFTKTPVFKVEAALMLRQLNEERSNQDEMLQIMGFGGNKNTTDEVKVLTSRDLMGRVIDTLHLCTTYSKKGEKYTQIQYPSHDLSVQWLGEQYEIVKVKLQMRKSGDYRVKVKVGQKSAQRFRVHSLTEPIHTKSGDLILQLNDTVTKGVFYAEVLPRILAVDFMMRKIQINRLAKESNIITLSTQTTCPALSVDVINTLMELYNNESAVDKTKLAMQTGYFLDMRLDVVAQSLAEKETTLESYKRDQHIADIDRTATNYQQTSESFERQVAEIESELSMLALLEKQVQNPENKYDLITGNVAITDNTLIELISDYNGHITHRNSLLQTATEQNPVVVQESELIDQKRASIQSGIVQARKSLLLRQKFVTDQQNHYGNRLASMPETERRYLEMEREKKTIEKQYLYLIEKREENALLLASDVLPINIIDRAQMDPNVVSPNRRKIFMLAILLGLMFPFCFYFFDIFRKEYL